MKVGLADNLGTQERRAEISTGLFIEPWEVLFPEVSGEQNSMLDEWALFILQAFAASRGQTTPPTTQNYTDAGAVGVVVGNTSAANDALVANGAFSGVAALQTILDAAVLPPATNLLLFYDAQLGAAEDGGTVTWGSLYPATYTGAATEYVGTASISPNLINASPAVLGDGGAGLLGTAPETYLHGLTSISIAILFKYNVALGGGELFGAERSGHNAPITIDAGAFSPSEVHAEFNPDDDQGAGDSVSGTGTITENPNTMFATINSSTGAFILYVEGVQVDSDTDSTGTPFNFTGSTSAIGAGYSNGIAVILVYSGVISAGTRAGILSFFNAR